MPHCINILPATTANKIAAGEVVQRPASAVKELIENSIDADARRISVVIREGGKSFLQVIDDGSGMGPEDAVLAFERHATSKISRDEDLENIRTLGFRGEALASISAVAQVELRTRPAASDVGTRVRFEGGILKENIPDAPAAGTAVTVRNLFYNTPARRKFLKSDLTEYKHIYDVIQRAALAHSGIAFTFISDDETILTLPPSSPAVRVSDLFGKRIGESVVSFKEDQGPLSVSGFLGRPEFARKGRTEQYLFLNGRPIVNRALNYAVVQAYEHLLEKGSFPLFVLYLTADPRQVDVNVHPSKLEVKFEDDSMVYRFIHGSVRKALSESNLIPAVGTGTGISTDVSPGFRFQRETPPEEGRIRGWEDLVGRRTAPLLSGLTEQDSVAPRSDGQPDTVSPAETSEKKTIVPWQLHNKYIIVPVENGMMIIDQHAAHERILYERTIARFNETNTESQQLLFPQTVQLTPGDAAIVSELLPLLEGLGFSLRFFGKTTLILDGVPLDVKPGAEGTILQDILDLYKEDDQKLSLEPRERLAQSFSCRAAIKAGDPLKEAEMRSLLDQLFTTSVPYVCPHGRPVLVRFPLADLDKRFGRTS